MPVLVTPPRPLGNDSSVSKVPLPLVLVRTQPGRNSREGFAQIGVNALTPQTYGAGAILANGARLSEIYDHYVLLERDGRSVRLYRLGEMHEPRPAESASASLLTVGGGVPPAPQLTKAQEQITDYLRPSTETYYVTSDHLHSSDLVTDHAANVLTRESFTPFGARRGSNWQGNPSSADYAAFGNSTRKGFTGHEMLDFVSLVHMGGRVYDPYLGRFTSADTVIQSLGATESINPYAYAWNDPLRYIDPTGHGILDSLPAFVSGVLGLAFGWAVGLNSLDYFPTSLRRSPAALLVGLSEPP